MKRFVLFILIILIFPTISFSDTKNDIKNLENSIEFLKSRVYYLEEKLKYISVYEDPEYPERPVEIYVSKNMIFKGKGVVFELKPNTETRAPLSDSHVCEFKTVTCNIPSLNLNSDTDEALMATYEECKWCGKRKPEIQEKHYAEPERIHILPLNRKVEE